MTLQYSQALRLVSRAIEQLQTHQSPTKSFLVRRLHTSALSSSITTTQWITRRAITTRTATFTSSTTRSAPEPSIVQPQGPKQPDAGPLPLSHHVRLLMRHVPHPVAIITSTDPLASTDRASKGMTVSSFNTVTLYPEPVVSFNVKRPSETLNALKRSDRFLVHLLAPTKAAAKLARDFSKGNTNLTIGNEGALGEFEFVPYTSRPHGEEEVGARHGSVRNESEGECNTSKNIPLPLLRRRAIPETNSTSTQQGEDFLFVLECKCLPRQIHVHDHTIVLGTVVRTIQQSPSVLKKVDGGGETGSRSPSNLSLMYADTRFWNMGTEL